MVAGEIDTQTTKPDLNHQISSCSGTKVRPMEESDDIPSQGSTSTVYATIMDNPWYQEKETVKSTGPESSN